MLSHLYVISIIISVIEVYQIEVSIFTIPRRDTWDHSLVSLTYLVDEHYALSALIAWKYLISNFPPSAAELFRLPPHRSGTHYQTQSFGINTAVVPAPIENFYFNDPLFISTVIVVLQ